MKTYPSDFYIENGLQVWTEFYHLKRGACCGSGCRHCPYPITNSKVVSLVPSWTETLLECDIEVVGRTRYCIHPQEKVCQISEVGGTKHLNKQKLLELNCNYILLDKEENKKDIYEFCLKNNIEPLTTHVQSLQDVSIELAHLGVQLKNRKLIKLSERWRAAHLKIQSWDRTSENATWMNLPGVMEWIRRPAIEPQQYVYIIWKDPWMWVAQPTFIADFLNQLGYKTPQAETKYPKNQDLSEFNSQTTCFLFSSEPYDFLKIKEQLKNNFSNPMALVNGESWSWFGSRALKFIESEINTESHNKNLKE
jgi:hypothetical protein